MVDTKISAKSYATYPFKLIETPIYAQNLIKPYDQYLESASAMALSHNVFIRGLNSIYLQAPRLKHEDYSDFINYCRCWCEIVNNHHQMEERAVFPRIEEITGEKGLMDGNVQQHHAFVPGLDAFKTYLETTSAAAETFSGAHLNTLIDAFGSILVNHLREEIPSLLALSRFGSSLPLLSIINQEAQRASMKLKKTEGSSFFFRNLDLGYEGGLWNHWPPIPSVIWWLLKMTVVRYNERWWKFASCDVQGQLRELPYLTESKSFQGSQVQS